MTFIEKFNDMKKKYGKIDESKLTDSFAVQIEMTDDDCSGIFYVAYVNGEFAVEPYDYRDNTASIKVSSKVLESILSCKSDAIEEFTKGNLTVEGEIGHALMLVEIMKKAPKKSATKKETAAKAPKKTETKTEVKKAPKKADAKTEVKKTETKKTSKKPAAKK